jgi:ATP-dependent RNA helicase DeaD
MAWFRINVGRSNNADPRWILPIICRLGHVTKKEVGPIRIFDRETKFGIVESFAPKFAAAVRRSSNSEDLQIVPASMPHEGERGHPGAKKGNGHPGAKKGKKPFPKGGKPDARQAKGPPPADRKPHRGPKGKKRGGPKSA